MSKKIIFINVPNISDAEISQVSDLDPLTWSHYKNWTERLLYPTARFGKDFSPFKNNLTDLLGDRAPAYQPGFKETWAQVCDSRYCQLRLTHFDRPWLVFWSGGIDSTTVLTSILKNSTPQDRENMTVVCNNASVYENPLFFLNHVQPNFKVISSDDVTLDRDTLTKYYTISGHPADALWCQFGGKMQALNLQQAGILVKDPFQHAELVIDIMVTLFKCTENFARWWYSNTVENIRSQDIPVETIHDFFWYMSFNFNWSGIKIRELFTIDSHDDPKTIEMFWRNVVFWYDTAEYQLWSMNNNQPGIKYGTSLATYKWPSKQYIHDYDHDDYYLNFKTKVSSSDHKFYKKDDWGFFCMLDDFSKLYLSNDIETIQTLMRDFVVAK